MVFLSKCPSLRHLKRGLFSIRMLSSSNPKPPAEKADAGQDVIFEEINKRGIITLNKPRILNSINLDMVLSISEKLEEWEDCMEMVIIKSSGGKAFCAGGDVVSVTKGGKDHSEYGKRFFRSEYLMNNLIGTYKVPYIAIMDGITMGGGVGLSVHGKYRIATEKTLFAMPETVIGLFPDVGVGHVLSRLKGKLGLYLGTTGYRLKGTDVVRSGIATHFCDCDKVTELVDALIKTEACGEKEIEEKVLSKMTTNASHAPFSLEKRMTDIDRIFSLPTIEQMFCELENLGSQWSLDTLKLLKAASPTSLKITKTHLEKCAHMTLQQVLQADNRIAGAMLEGRISMDFYEGVRALLIDKDKKPVWNPKNLEDITDEMIESLYKPLKNQEELTT